MEGLSVPSSFMNHTPGTVIRIDSAGYHVDTTEGTFRCSLRGRLKNKPRTTKKPVSVGDRVQWTPSGPNLGVIDSVEPRRNKLSRRSAGRGDLEHILVANLDQLLIVSSPQDPPFRSGLIDRMLVAADKNHLDAAICLNKADLIDHNEWQTRLAYYEDLQYPLLFTSAVDKMGLDALSGFLRGKTTVLSGHSGTGKSSLLSALQPGLSLRTGEISSRSGKGRHTTTSVSLLKLDLGGYVVDTPGIRSFGLWDIEPEDLSSHFPEIDELRTGCRFRRCTHTHEPDCPVLAAVESGHIHGDRYENYTRMLESLQNPDLDFN